MNPVPFGGIVIAGGSTAQALSTSAAKLINFTGNSAVNSNGLSGDPAVVPDYANNRVKVNTPGVYEVSLDLLGTTSADAQVTAQVYKNGVAVADLKSKMQMVASGSPLASLSFTGILNVARTDAPTGGSALKTFADPDATAGAGKPTGGFAGAGGAPSTMCAVEVYVTASTGTPNLTVVEGRLTLRRIG